ncbi:hypothetical protein [Bradyrhizobium sp. F1.13.3]|uniref:hypothetical protein n=1 Tax=Bradyrhizobium sp. F1.13.3 TaxID=3156351 RepID=UPI00339AD6A8
MIETLLAVLGAAGNVGSTYSAISGVATGRSLDRIVDLLERNHRQLVKLGDGILYSPLSHNVAFQSRAEEITELRRIRELLVPVHVVFSNIISTAVLRTPDRLRHQFEHDAWNCLYDIRPFTITSFDRESSEVPLLFECDGQMYVGWQKRGMLNSALGLEFSGTDGDAWIQPAPRGDKEAGELISSVLHQNFDSLTTLSKTIKGLRQEQVALRSNKADTAALKRADEIDNEISRYRVEVDRSMRQGMTRSKNFEEAEQVSEEEAERVGPADMKLSRPQHRESAAATSGVVKRRTA